MSKGPVSIIGAGLGGLTFAQCLLKRGIQATIYQQGANAPRHGYGITLHAPVYRPLLKVLNMDESSFRKRVAVDGAAGGIGAINPRKLVRPDQVDSASFRANRAKLEELLREGLDIKGDHAVQEVEETPRGVTICLANGQRIEQPGPVVGADGVHSKTRKSLLPNAQLNILPFVALNGKRRLSADAFEHLYSSAMQESNMIETQTPSGAILQISVNDVLQDTVSISWVYSRAAQPAHDPLFKPDRPLSSATAIPDDFFHEIASLGPLQQPFADVFDADKLKSDRILSWLMRTVEPISLSDLEELAKKRVFLIGDAVHAQPILGGHGANAAISDALDLSSHIENDDRLMGWYSSKHAVWGEGVDTSKKSISDMHAERKSVL